MRGQDLNQSILFSYLSPEERVPLNHPIRIIRILANTVLAGLSAQFDKMYVPFGRYSIPPEKLLRALLLQILYSVRSERLLMEQLNYNLLFRWFVGLSMDDEVWDATVYSKNRDRFLKANAAELFFHGVLEQAKVRDLLSDEHFTVDGTLIEAWASMKSYRPRENPPTEGSGSRGEMLRSDTHESVTDPEARLFKKGLSESKLGYFGHVVSENRNGFVVAACVTEANSKSEREAAQRMIEEMVGEGNSRRRTVGADKAYDEESFVAALRDLKVTPHVAQYTGQRGSAIDGRTTRHDGYQVSQTKRKRVEEIFGWLKTVGLMEKTRHRGQKLVQFMFHLSTATYNLVRMSKIPLASE